MISNKDSLPLFLSPQWLNEAKIIQRLVELIHSSQDEDVSMTGGVLSEGVVGPVRCRRLSGSPVVPR